MKLLLGALLTILCPLSCWWLGYSMKAGLVLMAAGAVVTVCKLEIASKRVLTAVYLLLFAAAPCFSFVIGMLVQNIDASHMDVLRISMNLLLLLAVQLIFLLLTSNIRCALIAGQILPLGLTLVHTYVFAFRGNSLMPADLLSVQTAANVAAEYDFTPSASMLYGLLLTGILIAALFVFPALKIKRSSRNLMIRTTAAVLSVSMLIAGSRNIQPQNWQNSGALCNGFLLNFVLQIDDTFVAKPEGYDLSKADELSRLYPMQDAVDPLPDIIIIMDESFADFRVFGNGALVDDQIAPYIDSMYDNTIRGFLTASVFGGSTANSEYECLSGNTMAFLPQASITYQQHYSGDSWTLVSHMKALGYDCIAMHPFHANGWMRDKVYPQMGFDRFLSLEHFPQKQLLREYVSDREMFEQIVELHGSQSADTPLFLFGITMQNHGGYAYDGAEFQTTVSLEKYPQAEQYLTLAGETDRAVEYLIEHYKTVERDTVIVFFGDHMPNVEPAFYEELNGGPFDTLDDQMKKQMVPFFVWANFDIEERQIPCSSINYLPLYTLEAAGLPLPPYLQFLKDTETVIPAINAYGYYSVQNQCFLPLAEATGAEADAIRSYAFLQYNNMFDENDRSDHFFGNEIKGENPC